MIEQGTFCGLKNARATCQRLVKHMFTNQLERFVKVYINNMLVKFLIAEQQIQVIHQGFEEIQHETQSIQVFIQSIL